MDELNLFNDIFIIIQCKANSILQESILYLYHANQQIQYTRLRNLN